ncbi:MAG: hypothetical protein R3F11_15570 [Verrucomicrobiales bacterium]
MTSHPFFRVVCGALFAILPCCGEGVPPSRDSRAASQTDSAFDGYEIFGAGFREISVPDAAHGLHGTLSRYHPQDIYESVPSAPKVVCLDISGILERQTLRVEDEWINASGLLAKIDALPEAAVYERAKLALVVPFPVDPQPRVRYAPGCESSRKILQRELVAWQCESVAEMELRLKNDLGNRGFGLEVVGLSESEKFTSARGTPFVSLEQSLEIFCVLVGGKAEISATEIKIVPFAILPATAE